MSESDSEGRRGRVPWPRAPLHRMEELGVYMVTSGTYGKAPMFAEGPRLKMLHDALLTLADARGWRLEAWAVFPNHYHFVGVAPGPGALRPFLQELHSRTAIALNRHDATPGRKVWHNYWDSLITRERSYLARLQYVHQNPVRHGLVTSARFYGYGSAAWFERNATPAQVRTLANFELKRVNIPDDF
jgi:putative transposase